MCLAVFIGSSLAGIRGQWGESSDWLSLVVTVKRGLSVRHFSHFSSRSFRREELPCFIHRVWMLVEHEVNNGEIIRSMWYSSSSDIMWIFTSAWFVTFSNTKRQKVRSDSDFSSLASCHVGYFHSLPAYATSPECQCSFKMFSDTFHLVSWVSSN